MENRREFISKTAMIAAGLPLVRLKAMGLPFLSGTPRNKEVRKNPVCIFTKPFQFLGYEELADVFAEAGVDGADLTVRKGGHVEPERVEEDLPRAVSILKERNLMVPMMVTSIKEPGTPGLKRFLETAAASGIMIYRMGYYEYNKGFTVEENIIRTRPLVEELARINEEVGIQGVYQNHVGQFIGAPVWDIWMLMKGLDPRWIGCQYDIRHAMVEGFNAWPRGLDLIKPFISNVVIKDTRWYKDDGKWKNLNVPLGEGFVDLDQFFSILCTFGFEGPLSLHFEYPFFDPEDTSLTHQEKRSIALKHLKRDTAYLNQKLKEHGLKT